MDSIDDILDGVEDSLADLLKRHLDRLDSTNDTNGFPLTRDFIRDIDEYEKTHPDHADATKIVRQAYIDRFKEKYNLPLETN